MTDSQLRTPTAASLSVLVVDDQPAFRKAASIVIAAIDDMYVVAEAADSESAVACAMFHSSLDVAIVDLHLGATDGTELCRRLLAIHPDLVVVLVSTTAREDLPADVYTCGARDFIAKSRFGPSTLIRTLTQTVDSPRHLR